MSGNGRSIRVLCVAALCLVSMACAGSQRRIPAMNFGEIGIETAFDRDDLVVLDTVTGTSTSEQRFLVVQIIDGDKYKVLGIPFFKEKYSVVQPSVIPIFGDFFTTTADRAYYNALEKTPDADFVVVRSLDHEYSGIPFLWDRTTVSFRGKAMKIRADGK